jgi:hypothetical protein
MTNEERQLHEGQKRANKANSRLMNGLGKMIPILVFMLVLAGCSRILDDGPTHIGPLTVTVQGNDVIICNSSNYPVTITITTALPSGAHIVFASGGDGGYGNAHVFTINENAVAGVDAALENLTDIEFITFTVYSPGAVDVNTSHGEITIL